MAGASPTAQADALCAGDAWAAQVGACRPARRQNMEPRSADMACLYGPSPAGQYGIAQQCGLHGVAPHGQRRCTDTGMFAPRAGFSNQAQLGNMGLRSGTAYTVQAPPRAVPRWPAGWRALPLWVHGCGFMDVCTPASGDRNRFAGGGHACMRRWRGCLAQRGLPFAGRNATGAGEARIQGLGLAYASAGTGRWQSPQLRELP